ncbi:MAG: calcium-binding protein [Gemmataceae bacterium]
MKAFIRMLFGRPTQPIRTRRAARPQLGLETLDRRELPSVTADVSSDGVLKIAGDSANDAVTVWSPNPDQIAVRAGTLSRAYPAEWVKQISFYGFGGNDRFESTASVPTLADGGDGNDFLSTGSRNDTLIGGRGNDTYHFELNRKLGSDRIEETFSGDTDTLEFWASVAVDVNLNNPTLTGRADGMVHPWLQLRLASGWLENVTGGYGDDKIVGSNWHNVLIGGGGNDDLFGMGGDDQLYGEAGADVLHGGDGSDVLWGQGQDDWLNGDGGDDILHGGDGADRLGADGPIDDPGNDWMNGDWGDDVVRGGTGNDTLCGGRENDWVDGGIGNDRVTGDYGNDTLIGGVGDDALGASVWETGTDGNDILFAVEDEPGNDTLYGDETNPNSAVSGNDTVRGGTGDDFLYGGGGNDRLGAVVEMTYHDDQPIRSGYTAFCEDGRDFLYGNAGDDVLCGGNGNDLLDGGADNDILGASYEITWEGKVTGGGWKTNYEEVGEDGNDELYGGTGYDVLRGGAGSDYLNGGGQVSSWLVDALNRCEYALTNTNVFHYAVDDQCDYISLGDGYWSTKNEVGGV